MSEYNYNKSVSEYAPSMYEEEVAESVFEPYNAHLAYAKEKNFEAAIEEWLLNSGGYVKGNQNDYDYDKAIDMKALVRFIEETQGPKWRRYVKKYGDKSEQQLYQDIQADVTRYGLIYVLRKGIDNMGIKLRLAYFEPNSELNEELMEKYRGNTLTVIRQFAVDKTRKNIIDMVLSLNGIPIVALELKNQLTNQNLSDSLRQWKQDRSNKDELFRPNHRILAYFGVDLYEAAVATELKGDKTFFMPYNQGSNGAGNDGGAGNPDPVDGDYVTSYLWKRVLNRNMLLRILQRYISKQETEELVLEVRHGKEVEKKVKDSKILWPRYHQLDVVEKLATDTAKNGVGHNYLIQHSAGSGKSNSIAWLTYQLAALHDAQQKAMFDCVFVVTDRRILNKQLRETVLSFDHVDGQIEYVLDGEPSTKLSKLIHDNNTRIIVCTLHRFPVIHKEVPNYPGRKYAIIVDEAHSSQSGKGAEALRTALADTDEALHEWAEIEEKPEEELQSTFDEIDEKLLAQGAHSNLSFYAFTATPKPKTLQIFGQKKDDGKYGAFHNYSMRQAIEEGFIKDVLDQYTTFDIAYKVEKRMEEDPEYEETPATKAVKAFHDNHQRFIDQLTEIIVEKFRAVTMTKMNGEAKAMVVCPSRPHALRIFKSIKDYCEKMKYADINPLVAFSGKVEYFGKEYTESKLNSESGRNITEDRLPLYFGSKLFNVLVVADKYQTGFDEPKLHTMFVLKRLKNVKAVQTLSRLNRYCSGKQDTYVFDFVNTTDEIKSSFEPFYKETSLIEPTDVNKVYHFRKDIQQYNLWTEKDEDDFFNAVRDIKSKNQRLAVISATLKPIVNAYSHLDEATQNTVRGLIKSFLRVYTFMAQIARTYDRELFKAFLFADNLYKVLPRRGSSAVELDDKLKLVNSKITEDPTTKIGLGDDVDPMKGEQPKSAGQKDVKIDTLQNIIDKVNTIYEGNFSKADEVIITTIYERLTERLKKKLERHIKNNGEKQFETSIFPDMFDDIARECYVEQAGSYKKLFENPEFYSNVMAAMAKALYNSLGDRRDIPFEINRFREKFLSKLAPEFEEIKGNYQPLEEAVDCMISIIRAKTDDRLDGFNETIINSFNQLYCGNPSYNDKNQYLLTLYMKFETYLKKIYYLLKGEFVADHSGGELSNLSHVMQQFQCLWGLRHHPDPRYRVFSQKLEFVKNLRNALGHLAPRGSEAEVDVAIHILSTMYLYTALLTRSDLEINGFEINI